MSVVTDTRGNTYISNNYNKSGEVNCGQSFISKFDAAGMHEYYHLGLNSPRGITLDQQNNLYIADLDCDDNSYTIKVVTPIGKTFTLASGIEGDIKAFGLAYDIFIDDSTLYMARPNDVIAIKIDPKFLNNTGSNARYDQYNPKSRLYDPIYKNAQGQYVLKSKDGSQTVFDETGLQIESLTPQGLAWRYRYDNQNRLIRRTNIAGQQYQFEYDNNGLSKIIDPANREIHFTIDEKNHLLKVEEPENMVMQYTYNDQHLVTSKTDSRNNTTQYRYGKHDNVIEVKHANGEIRQFHSALIANLIAKSDLGATGLSIKHPYYYQPEQKDIYINGCNIKKEFVTDADGSLITEIDALGYETHYEYDRHRRVSKKIFADGSFETYQYNSNHQVIEKNDQAEEDDNGTNQITTTYQYDSRLNLSHELNKITIHPI